jgi:hypothetical protein
MRRHFAIGFTIGVAVSAIALFSGTISLWRKAPLWQTLLLFPGFHVGFGFDRCCGNWFSGDSRVGAAVLAGVTAVGLWYGLVMCALAVVG